MAKKGKIDQKQIAIILLIIGIGLLVWGFQLYGGFGEKLSRSVGGASSNQTMLILIGGAACTALGAFRLFKK